MKGRLYLVFVPLVLVAVGFLGWSSFSTTFNFEMWGVRSIIASTYTITKAKADTVERKIIDSDNALLAIVDLENLPELKDKWTELTNVSHAVDTIIILDPEQNLHFYVSDHEGEKLGTVLYDFREHIRPELVLEGGRTTKLRHIHGRYGGRPYMISYKSKPLLTEWYTVVLNYNMDYLKEVLLPDMLEDLSPSSLYNVVDGEGRLIAGQRFKEHGEFSVARRFPSTLYDWRLQVAPTEASVYEATSQRRYVYDTVTVVISFVVIFLGMAFFIYAAEKERRVGMLKSEFVANVSHELKTPLSIIRLFSEMLSLGKVENAEKERHYHDVIIQECERLTALIDNLLDFARLEGGRMEFEMTETDPGSVVAAAAEIYRYRLERENIELETEIEPDVSRVLMDPHAITLVIVNLLDNAAKYAQGTDRVLVRVAESSGRVLITVRDWGVGVGEDERRRIFERFYRGRDAQKRHQRGTGIGLTLVKSIVESHQGTVRLEVPPPDGGPGTQFDIALPAR
jgi:two-component system phosphate regulon sensor histidine kinase PhoR